MRASEMMRAWEVARAGRLYGVMENGTLLLEPTFDDEGRYEAVVRLFLSSDEAEEYERQVMGYEGLDPEKSCVTELSLDDLWKYREALYELAQRNFDCKFRIELCRLISDEWPETLDVLFDFHTTIH